MSLPTNKNSYAPPLADLIYISTEDDLLTASTESAFDDAMGDLGDWDATFPSKDAWELPEDKDPV